MSNFESLKMQTQNLADGNFAALAAMFPNAVTETVDENGVVVRTIDVDVLAQEINTHVVKGKEERYQFIWPDKKKSILLANAPIAATLRPCREESINFDTTENLYIEGDNLDVLKLLRETYLNRIKMIYIDPPYNTGNDFVYDDDFAEDSEEFLIRDGQYDNDGNRMVRNLDSNGRFHTDWLNMMYPRLRIARDLLTEDGVIFISIDDGEVHNLRKVCDEVFGERNCISEICHKSRASISNDKIISPNHNIILLYAKSQGLIHDQRRYIGLDPDLGGFDLDDNDGRGAYRFVPVDGPGGAKKGNPHYEFLGVEGYWRFSQKTMQEKYNAGLVVKRGNSLYQKYFLSTAQETRRTDNTWWDDGGLMSTATSKLKTLMGDSTFDTPKPIKLIMRMLKLFTHFDKKAIILDFFSGSATTAHAVMQLNAEDGGKRKFIMVQLPEITDENSEVFKADYKNICEIGKERIRRAGKKINAELRMRKAELRGNNSEFCTPNSAFTPNSELDIGFRVLKLDSTNMKDVYYTPQETADVDIAGLVDNIKPDRTPEDLLFQVMLDLGILLSSKIEKRKVDGVDVFFVNDNYLIACFESVTNDIMTKIAQAKPYYAVFRDSGFASDSTLVNMEQIFKTYSPSTQRKVL